jgi:hypothetical protein
MKVREVTLGLSYIPGQLGRTVSIYLGEHFALNVHEGDRYLKDCLVDGTCSIGVPKRGCDLFIKHKLYQITHEDNPEVMGVLCKVFLKDNERDFKVEERRIGERIVGKTAKLKLKNDKTIVELLNDGEFKKLDSSMELGKHLDAAERDSSSKNLKRQRKNMR